MLSGRHVAAPQSRRTPLTCVHVLALQGATLSAEATAERLQLQPHGPLSALLRSTTAYGTWCRMLRNLYSIFGASRIYASPTNLLDTLRQVREGSGACGDASVAH